VQIDDGLICQLPAQHLEHGYALTGHAAQRLTIDRAFVLMRAECALAEWGYVTAIRARIETRLYAVGPEPVDDTGLRRDDAESATRQRTAALTRTAASCVLLGDRNGSPGSGPTRLERDRLRREIESRGRLLASTRQHLGSLGWMGRRRHGPALRARVDDQLRALADLRLALRSLPAPGSRRQPPTLDRSSAPRAREPPRQPVERGMGLER
jgi:hypothetical protein